MSNRLTKEECILLIKHKYDELGYLPKKSDFDVETVSMIKSYFGPWPHALEMAGVKEPNFERIEKKREKRQRAKKNRIKYRKTHNKEDKK